MERSLRLNPSMRNPPISSAVLYARNGERTRAENGFGGPYIAGDYPATALSPRRIALERHDYKTAVLENWRSTPYAAESGGIRLSLAGRTGRSARAEAKRSSPKCAD